ncbi:ABC transporter substrate-binding protein [Methylocella silvestris]|uniref:ABC transporter substrate-binding protein n=1 Tax=Methylocella silvestris TaxID=199596 RepID=A0A2J7THQ0_METSI|nr:ABC transporter substrate-binding protein [Methylocella silvestris]PNG26289.1 ABC transporter substrate-binding protein [Methylocella silvestris]
MNAALLSRRGFVVSALAFPAAATLAAAPVVVSSKLDLEGALLGQMMLIALRRAGVPVVANLQIGPTAILRQALISGAVDLCVEYTGNAAFFFHQEDDPVWRDARAGFLRAAMLDLKANNLVWLDPAHADNSWVISVPNTLAREKALSTLEDFAKWVNSGARVRLAASAEFVESEAGLPAFEAAYHFHLGADQLLVLSGGETTATMKAASAGISGVNAAMAYASDGALDALDLRALEDPRRAEPVYAPAPVIRADTLAAYPQIGGALAPVFAGLHLKTLRALNERIAVEGEDAALVARDYMMKQNLL